MALKTLSGLSKIGDFEITREVGNFSHFKPVFISDELNQIAFQIQDGPVKEVGVNGCQVNEIVAVAKLIIEGLNKDLPCRENSMAITKLDEALMWLEKRTKDRQQRQVEGTAQA